MRYLYKVIKSESPEMEVGRMFITQEKLHDGRKKEPIVELSDVSCRAYWLECINTFTEQEYEDGKRNKVDFSKVKGKG